MPIVFMPGLTGKIRTQDMLKLTPMKLDARRAFIKSLRASRRYCNKYTCGESSSWKHKKTQSDTRGMQCGCRKVWKWKI
jgi:hypothetical protein